MLKPPDCLRVLVIIVLNVIATAVGAAGFGSAPAAASSANAALADARSLRSQGCGSHLGTRVALRASGALNAAALQWSRGASLKSAVEQSGYREQQSAELHVSGDATVLLPAMRSKLCSQLTDASFTDLGSIQRAQDTWIIIAAPFAPPAVTHANDIASELLQQINRARAQPRRCGNTSFSPAAALQSSALLRRAAEAHAQEMVSHNYFAHEGVDGSTPAQRVSAVGYGYRLVGENIASGPQSAAEAAEGWLASPGHCE